MIAGNRNTNVLTLRIQPQVSVRFFFHALSAYIASFSRSLLWLSSHRTYLPWPRSPTFVFVFLQTGVYIRFNEIGYIQLLRKNVLDVCRYYCDSWLVRINHAAYFIYSQWTVNVEYSGRQCGKSARGSKRRTRTCANYQHFEDDWNLCHRIARHNSKALVFVQLSSSERSREIRMSW